MSELINVEVAYALPDKQLIKALEVPVGTSAIDAVRLSGIDGDFDDLTLEPTLQVGIFGKAIKADQPLQAGDRVEIYRPLQVDPNEVRKRRAAEAKERRAAEEGP
ncbi:MAG: RnfH family protein [Luminiphilus sp.]|nr:RnfH family protein [Luminiphilus sp.]